MKITSLVAFICLSSPLSQAQTVVNVVDGKSDLSTFHVALEAADLEGTLNGNGPFTMFAPTDQAFASMDQGMLRNYIDGPEWYAHLRSLMLYHISRGSKIMARDIPSGGKQFPTLFVNLITEETQKITPKKSQVQEGDMSASNGVVHKVNKVFIPTPLTTTLLDSSDAIPGFGQVSLLFAYVPGLEDILKNDIITIFAPNEEAIAAMGAITIGELSLDKIINNHMVSGLWPSIKLTHGTRLTSLANIPLEISATGGKTKVSDAEIKVFNGVASNGVIHGIDKVLLPGGAP